MKFPMTLIVLSIALCSCRPTMVSNPGFTGYVDDQKSSKGLVQFYENGTIVTIGAGHARIGGGTAWSTWYIIDTMTQNCWFNVGGSIARMPCCSLLYFEPARSFLSFANEQFCLQESVK